MPTNPKKPSLRSVSRIAGVSPATVSRVLNNSAILPEATRKCVMDAVRESGYQTNPQLSRVMRQNRSGRREVRGVTDTIGYLTPLRLLDSGYSGDGYYSEAIRGVREELAKHQKHLMWEAAESGQASLPQMILDGRVDGVLVEATIPQETLEVLARQAPVVLMDRSCADVHGVKADEVLADFEAAMLSSLGHLWSLGHRNMVTFQHAIQTYDQRQSLDGFGRFFREVGASPVHPDLCQPCPIDPRNNARVIADYVQRLVHARPCPPRLWLVAAMRRT